MKVDTKNTKVLIFSDIHQEWQRARNIIDKEKADVIVCLGDLFDSHVYDDNLDVIKTVALYRDIINNPNNIMLLSNHDLAYHYIFNKTTYCSGFTSKKWNIINSMITPAEWNKVHWFCTVDDFLCTHAGLGKPLIPEASRGSLEDVVYYLEQEQVAANRALANGRGHWFWQAGQARGGPMPFGGIVWSDWKHEFLPIEGISQLYGHTASKGIARYNTVYPNNICVDCHLNEYLIIENGKMEIKKYIDL